MAYCDKCGNFDKSYLEGGGCNDEWKNARKEFDEDYQMPNGFECLCEICFDILNAEGKIAWKDDKNPFECTSL